MFLPKMRTPAPSANMLCVARLNGYSLRFNKKSEDRSGKCNVERDPAGVVWGVVFEIADEERPALDRSEGGYTGAPTPVPAVRVDGETVPVVITYIANPDRIDNALQPYSWYKEFVVKGADRGGVKLIQSAA